MLMLMMSRGAPSVTSGGGLPTWLAGADVNEWVELATQIVDAQSGFTSPGGSKPLICSYSGATVKSSGSELFVWGGGHTDYAGNELYSIRLADNAPAFTRRRDPTATVGDPTALGDAYYGDGRPTARHTYWTLQFINARNRLMSFGAPAVWGNGNGHFSTVDGFDPETNDFDPEGTYPSQTGINLVSAGIAKDADENVYVHNYNTGVLYKWTQASNTWSSLGNKDVYVAETAYACDTTRNRILRVRGSGGAWPEGYLDLNSSGDVTNITFSGASADQITSGSLVYDPVVDCFWFWKRGSTTLYKIHPTTWAVTEQSTTGPTPDNTYTDGRQNIYGRLAYCPELKGLVFVKQADSNAFFIRTA